MNAPFFIVGLPRTRSAWLANLLTYGPSFCLHEGLRHCGEPKDLVTKLRATGAEWPGDADPMIPQFFPAIQELFPQARYVFVDRNADEAFNSYAEALEGTGVNSEAIETGWHAAVAALAAMRANLRNQHTLTIQFAALDQYHTCAAVWEACVPNVPFNPLRWELLHELRVTAIPAKISKRLDREKLSSLLGQAYIAGARQCVKGSETTPAKRAYYELIRELTGANHPAFTWFMDWLALTLTWDHIVDNDPIDKHLAAAAIGNAMLEWPVNAFWREHGVALRPTIAGCIGAWEHGKGIAGEDWRAWTGYAEVPLAMALLLGGRMWAEKFNQPLRNLVRQLYQEHQEASWQ